MVNGNRQVTDLDEAGVWWEQLGCVCVCTVNKDMDNTILQTADLRPLCTLYLLITHHQFIHGN